MLLEHMLLVATMDGYASCAAEAAVVVEFQVLLAVQFSVGFFVQCWRQ